MISYFLDRSSVIGGWSSWRNKTEKIDWIVESCVLTTAVIHVVLQSISVPTC